MAGRGVGVIFDVVTMSVAEYDARAAEIVARALPPQGSLMLTGGATAAKVYPELAKREPDLSGLEIVFSDERSVPPDDDASNFGVAQRLLLSKCPAKTVHRMRGEDAPDDAARLYSDEIEDILERGIDVALLGLGEDCHIAALFPGSKGLTETDRPCIPVRRPDGLGGITLTPPALLRAERVFVITTGSAKAEAVRRMAAGSEEPVWCPAVILSAHPGVTLLLDEPAARLSRRSLKRAAQK